MLSDGTENRETEYVRGVTELDTTERLSLTGWFTGFTVFTTFQPILYVSNDSQALWFHSFAPRCPFLRKLRKVECGTDNRNAKEKEIKGLSESIYDHTRCYRSVTMSCLTLCDPMDCSTPGFPVLHHLLEFAETHVIELVMPSNHLSHPLSSPSSPALNLSQHKGLFQWVSSLYQVTKVLELQFQHQSFHWIFRTDFL